MIEILSQYESLRVRCFLQLKQEDLINQLTLISRHPVELDHQLFIIGILLQTRAVTGPVLLALGQTAIYEFFTSHPPDLSSCGLTKPLAPHALSFWISVHSWSR